MNQARENYKQLIDDIFGDNVCTIDTTISDTNNVISALVHEQFDDFTLSFKARLKRIAQAYHDNKHLRDSIKQAVNQVADKNNWDGAFSELAVLDYFSTFTDTSAKQLELDVTIPASDTLASEMGYSNANLDGYFSNFDIFFDIKVLSDKSGQIVDGIIKQVKDKLKISGVSVLPSFNSDLPFEEFQKNRNQLYKELHDGINILDRTKSVNSKIIDSLSYRLAWNPSVISGASEYSPLEHAKKHHALIFQHAKKFHRNKCSAIIFVNFPWFGEKIPPFDGVKESFYKNMCTNFFNDYKVNTTKGKELNRRINTDISAFDVTKHLSLIIFIDDHSILRNTTEKNNLSASSYINTNAIHAVSDSEFFKFLSSNTRILNDNDFTG